MHSSVISVRDIIKDAMKKLAVLPLGREPSALQADDGLVALQALYREWVGQGVFGRLNDVLVKSATYNACEWERVVCDVPDGVVVSLPETITSELLAGSHGLPAYDARAPDYGRGYVVERLPRAPRDHAPIVIADVYSDSEEYYLYDANRAYWVRLDALTLDTGAPLSNRYENGLKAALAARLASSYGREVTPFLQGEVNSFRSSISNKLDRSRTIVAGEYF